MSEVCGNCGENPDAKTHEFIGQIMLFNTERVYPPGFGSTGEEDNEVPYMSNERRASIQEQAMSLAIKASTDRRAGSPLRVPIFAFGRPKVIRIGGGRLDVSPVRPAVLPPELGN